MSNAALIDNSTYFSYRGLMEGGELDVYSFYNYILFLEALITVDELRTAPSSSWQPSLSDTLFSTGVCTQISASRLGERALSTLFQTAIDAAKGDIAEPTTRKLLSVSAETALRTGVILDEMRERAENPFEFLNTYSVSVFRTDTNSAQYQKRTISTGIKEDAPSEQHVAHYLLRTRAALEFAFLEEARGVPYIPHSHRSDYVRQCLQNSLVAPEHHAGSLLRFAESEIAKRSQSPLLEKHSPIILTVLSGCTSATELENRALEIRGSREAVRYRSFVSAFNESLNNGNVELHNRAHQEINQVKVELIRELNKLYTPKTQFEVAGQIVGEFTTDVIMDTLEPKGMELVAESVVSAVVKKAITLSVEELDRLRRRHRTALVFGLINKVGGYNVLNDLVKRTFGREFTREELHQLDTLHRQRGAQVWSVAP